MGEHRIRDNGGDADMRTFVRALLEDVQALELMIQREIIETGVRRIGAEQELFLVDSTCRPTRTALQILDQIGEGDFTTELGLFNLEANLPPLELGGGCLSRLERELVTAVERVRVTAREFDTQVVMCGILPTLTEAHLGLDHMTPDPRYFQLNETMVKLRGGEFRTLIKGADELRASHDNVMLEACNTSFQIHFQVSAGEFPQLYNLAQAVTAPVLAAAVNSPVLLRHRLWHETRVALFQQSLDSRSETSMKRGSRRRVSFGDRWVEDSVIEIFREDIARFRALIAVDTGESPLAMLERGEIPKLTALCLHNGTVYRWNRPCYGVKDGVAHLRIENRVLPAGPSIVDEVANAAFFFGLMCALDKEYGDVRKVLDFDDVKANFLAAARYGLHARFRWLGGKRTAADELICDHLLPLARSGLAAHGIDSTDIDRYLGLIEERVHRDRTGAQWTFNSLAGMGDQGSVPERYRALTAAMIENQLTELPVHEWGLAELAIETMDRESYRALGQFMTTDLFTVQPEDIVDLAASLMEWEHVRHVPVEDHEGCLVGLISHRVLLRMLARGARGEATPVAVREIMCADPVTATPQTSTIDALRLMREHKVGCLPIIKEGKLVGIVTEHDFANIAAGLLDRWLREE